MCRSGIAGRCRRCAGRFSSTRVSRPSSSDAGARALHYAASELLGTAFAEAAGDGLSGPIVIETGPPISVRAN